MFPDFIGIGAQKAGTTWLDRNLRAHPQVWMPKRKELHYFDRRIADTVPPDDEWYASMFAPGEGHVTGEITPAYSMLDQGRVAHVHRIVPHAKIVFFMRNPIERAWSQAVMQFNRRKKREIETVAQKRIHKHFNREGSRLRTDYSRTLENWQEYYSEEQVFVGFLEDIHFFPRDLLRRLYSFLGVDPSFESSDVEQTIHSRSVGRMPTRLGARLAHIYHDDIRRLAERFGGYATFWLHCAERLIDDPPAEESIAYPLWNSPFYRAWAGDSERLLRPPRLQSGPLSSIGTTDTGA